MVGGVSGVSGSECGDIVTWLVWRARNMVTGVVSLVVVAGILSMLNAPCVVSYNVAYITMHNWFQFVCIEHNVRKQEGQS